MANDLSQSTLYPGYTSLLTSLVHSCLLIQFPLSGMAFPISCLPTTLQNTIPRSSLSKINYSFIYTLHTLFTTLLQHSTSLKLQRKLCLPPPPQLYWNNLKARTCIYFYPKSLNHTYCIIHSQCKSNKLYMY